VRSDSGADAAPTMSQLNSSEKCRTRDECLSPRALSAAEWHLSSLS
jgi:hypothetical protein